MGEDDRMWRRFGLGCNLVEGGCLEFGVEVILDKLLMDL